MIVHRKRLSAEPCLEPCDDQLPKKQTPLAAGFVGTKLPGDYRTTHSCPGPPCRRPPPTPRVNGNWLTFRPGSLGRITGGDFGSRAKPNCPSPMICVPPSFCMT